ncbi:Gfo/Idh/MocA family oxidoreductase [Acrocarpospora macrocephala]|uniref:Oxidoreductase n=1 Tax=Acrocarpospora macrocephala TaxID=150177 RepID=A0A5M3X1X4_9ACTN|nr:Gfo/Idh/MocA family oxidoreductase [Acrocarpospora macrocephala]GES15737.1 oxidoreductase [Acrocarpospora macrocephala]
MTDLRVGVVGHGFMGRAHAHAWRSVGHFFDLPLSPRLSVLCGRSPAVGAAAVRLGFPAWETDWRRLVERDDVDLVDICTPGDTHAPIAIVALRAGKHVLCEKPLANSVAEAEAMVRAARDAPGLAMAGFNFRRLPSVEFARELVAKRAGEIRHVRAAYLNGSLVDPEAPMAWRLRVEEAGSGALGDLGAHAIDLAQHLAGDLIAGVSGITRTFVPERPLADGGGRGSVTVDDAAAFVARFSRGALGVFEATRYADGRAEGLRVELDGSLGSVIFDLGSPNEVSFLDATDPPAERGFRRIRVAHPAWWYSHAIGYEHTFTHQARDLVEAIGSGVRPTPSFEDGLRVQRVLDAVATSSGDWRDVLTSGVDGC